MAKTATAKKVEPKPAAPVARKKPARALGSKFDVTVVDVESLKAHPKNYREHPDDQLEHIESSLREHGFYKNVVVSSDGVILAGHGVVKTLKKMRVKRVPVVRLGIKSDDPRALKILAGDNEISRLANIDDRGLAAILRGIAVDMPAALLGTGYDAKMLAALTMIADPGQAGLDAAAEWVGMPEYKNEDQTAWKSIVVNFASDKDMQAFARIVKQTLTPATRSIWYPPAQIGRYADKAYVASDGAKP